MGKIRSGRRRKMPAPLSSDPFADERGLDKRKLRQLCRQVERALSCALGDEGAGDVLLELVVHDVLPWPNASRLLVAVAPSAPDAAIDRDRILEHLDAQRGALREVVADAIHRKRTPELCFEVFAPPSADQSGVD